MKYSSKIVFVLSFSMLFNCSDTSEDFLKSETNNSIMNAEVDDVLMSFEANEFNVFNDETTSVLGYSKMQSIRIRFPKTEGIYSFNDIQLKAWLEVGNVLGVNETISYRKAEKGSVVITVFNDEIIKGNFEFATFPMAQGLVNKITNGVFEIQRN